MLDAARRADWRPSSAPKASIPPALCGLFRLAMAAGRTSLASGAGGARWAGRSQ